MKTHEVAGRAPVRGTEPGGDRLGAASALCRRLGGWRAAVLAIGMLALALRSLGLDRRGLWYDELLSANFTANGPAATLLTVLRFDVHPPLYYLQLSLWSLLGRGDAWLMLNSIAWSTAAVVLLAVGTSRLHGRAAGLWAGGLLAVAPAALAYADQVRMYPMMTALIVLVWWAQAHWLARPSKGRSLLLLGAELAVIYCQTAGIIMLSGCVALGAWRAIARFRAGDRRGAIGWVLLQAAAGIGTIPVLIVDLSRNVGHIRVAGPDAMLATWTFLSTGACVSRDYALACGFAPGPVPTVLGIGLLAVLAVLLVIAPRLRLDIVTLIATPVFLVAVVSLLIRPLWLDRMFLATTPFLVLVLARLAGDPAVAFETPLRPGFAWPRWGVPALIGLLWLGMGTGEQVLRRKTDGYTAAAAWVAANARPGDAILMADKVEYWAFLWRFAGPGWGDPLHSYVASGSWAKLTREMPAAIQSRLKPDRLCVPVRGVTTELLSPRQACPPARGDVFTLGLPDERFWVPGRRVVEQRRLDPLVVQRWRAGS